MNEQQIQKLAASLNNTDDSEFIRYLQDTLIPDLKTSGKTFAAEDFENLIRICGDLVARLP